MADAHLVRSPELGELRALTSALEHGSMGAAARALGISQPALSKRLRHLEAVVGVPLLRRTSTGVRPTDAGSRLAVGALRVLRESEALDGLAADLRGTPEPVRLASSPVVAESLLPRVLSTFHRAGSHVAVELVVANSSVVRDLVTGGRADLGIAAALPGSEDGSPVFAEDELLVAVPPGHPWGTLEEIPLEEVVRTPLVLRDPGANQRKMLDGLLGERGLHLRAPFAEVGSTAAAIATAWESGTPAILSRVSTGAVDAVRLRPIGGLRLVRRFVLLAAPDRAPSAAQREVVAALWAGVASTGGETTGNL